MKVLAFNCSPKMGKGNTALILDPFLEGMREAGAEVELFYNRKLNINSCRGCLICQRKTPGVCAQKDDMQMLLPKLREADIWVFAAPVYFAGIPGPMKNLIDRTNPFCNMIIELQDGHTICPPRQGYRYGKIVLVSSCDYWEMDNFDPVLGYMKLFDFAGALLRPHTEALRPMMKMGEPLDDIFEAAKEAGGQLVRDGEMSPETLKIVSRELMPLEKYMEFYNQRAQEALERLKK